MEAKRGLWSHGIPPFILTSIHSVEEDTEGRGVLVIAPWDSSPEGIPGLDGGER